MCIKSEWGREHKIYTHSHILRVITPLLSLYTMISPHQEKACFIFTLNPFYLLPRMCTCSFFGFSFQKFILCVYTHAYVQPPPHTRIEYECYLEFSQISSATTTIHMNPTLEENTLCNGLIWIGRIKKGLMPRQSMVFFLHTEYFKFIKSLHILHDEKFNDDFY